MKIDGALVKEQGVTFGIIVVKSHVLHNKSEQDNMRRFGMRLFGNMPIILMTQDSRGIPTYQGRRDIVNFLSKINPSRIPFKRYTVSDGVA